MGSSNLPKVVLFDLDGVLWDSLKVHERAFAEVARSHKLDLPAYAEITGKSTFEVFSKYFQDAASLEFIEQLVVEKQTLARESLTALVIDHKVIEGLDFLAKRCRLALVSGSSRASVNIFLSKIPVGIFETIISGDDTEKSKPNSEPYFAAVKALSVNLSECVVVEDSLNGIASAHAAGLNTIHISNGVCLINQIHECKGTTLDLFDEWTH